MKVKIEKTRESSRWSSYGSDSVSDSGFRLYFIPEEGDAPEEKDLLLEICKNAVGVSKIKDASLYFSAPPIEHMKPEILLNIDFRVRPLFFSGGGHFSRK